MFLDVPGVAEGDLCWSVVGGLPGRFRGCPMGTGPLGWGLSGRGCGEAPAGLWRGYTTDCHYAPLWLRIAGRGGQDE